MSSLFIDRVRAASTVQFLIERSSTRLWPRRFPHRIPPPDVVECRISRQHRSRRRCRQFRWKPRRGIHSRGGQCGCCLSQRFGARVQARSTSRPIRNDRIATMPGIATRAAQTERDGDAACRFIDPAVTSTICRLQKPGEAGFMPSPDRARTERSRASSSASVTFVRSIRVAFFKILLHLCSA